jgi:NAD(P)-dependent dehydrogenase (short-subunit alcohol dehydrogenase family)
MDRLKNKVVAIAGAGGIGTGLAKRYAAEGASVMIGDISKESAEEAAQAVMESGGSATALALDIGDAAAIADFVARAEKLYGGLDGFHANAANFSHGAADTDAVDIELTVFDDIMRVNAGGALRCARAAIPAFQRRGGGSILFTSSGSAHSGEPIRIAYSMSKTATHSLARHIAKRWGKENIRANVIAPGVTLHPRLERAAPDLREWALRRIPLTYLGTPEDIAAMATLLMSDEGRFITGQVISVDGGSTMRL